MTWLILSFIMCVFSTWTTPQDCAVILNDIATYEEYNPNGYVIGIDWYPYESDANRVANYWYQNSSWDIDMIATFIAEASFNKDAVWKAWERGICQLLPNRTNNKWINDERWSDIMFQAEVCLDKWKVVPKPSKIWYWRNKREKYKQQIYYFE